MDRREIVRADADADGEREWMMGGRKTERDRWFGISSRCSAAAVASLAWGRGKRRWIAMSERRWLERMRVVSGTGRDAGTSVNLQSVSQSVSP